MEANQTTCPQCGLVNNHLAEACAQCGLIFAKNDAAKTSQDLREEQKRKAIEEAEAILDQTLPSLETDAFGNDIAKNIDLPEDTVEMRIPVETADSGPEKSKLEENQDLETHEIEMEAIEAPAESSTDTTAHAIDAEELFLAEIETTQKIGATAAEKAETDAASSAEAEKAVDSSDPMINPDGVKREDPGQKKAEVIESATGKDHAAVEAGPIEQKMSFGEKQQPAADQEEAVQSGTQTRPDATIEMPQESAETQALTKKQESNEPEEAREKHKQIQVLEALKKQREKQAKVEASNKEQAAQANGGAFAKQKLTRAKAEALQKQKLAQAKVEALKKQKAAQAKALALKKQRATQARLEALKKQKEAQAKAEASAQEMEVASAGILPAASKGSVGNHEKLLSLLKRYKGKAIGINYDNSAEIKEAELVDANEEFFSVIVKDKKLQYSYPLKTILTIVEGQEGVETGDEGQRTKFDAVIKVYPFALFK
jgi:hypothetical protein